MFLELESVFNTPGLELPFAYALPEQPAELEGAGLPLAERPLVEGILRNRAGVVELHGTARVALAAACDRCAAPIAPVLLIPLEHTLVLSLNDAANDALILVEQYRYSPDALVWEDVVLAMPPKLLCRPDCLGLCSVCGQNRNEGICACANQGDPRMAALRQLLAD
ncbi:MAG: DUF177 domain-containing protein [Oscillospiraceae bacterium]|jgi:uncharacterized protein|nr:DUF177 domain-containing protein [Oscillospiraceae bacterium]